MINGPSVGYLICKEGGLVAENHYTIQYYIFDVRRKEARNERVGVRFANKYL